MGPWNRETEPKGGRKQTQRPGTRTGCVPDAGPHWLGQCLSLCLGPGCLPRVRAAVASGSCNLRVRSPNSQACLREAANCRREMKWGTGPDSNRNPNVPLLQDILKRVQVTPKPLPLYTELPMGRYRDISRKAHHHLSQPRKKAGDIIVQF